MAVRAAVPSVSIAIMYESGENYLETILVLKRTRGSVRSVDIARELGFSRPSVSRAVGLLKEQGYIATGDNGEISLTVRGQEEAGRIYERHQILTRFLVQTAGVSEDIAEKDACRMEHILSPQTFGGIKAFLEE